MASTLRVFELSFITENTGQPRVGRLAFLGGAAVAGALGEQRPRLRDDTGILHAAGMSVSAVRPMLHRLVSSSSARRSCVQSAPASSARAASSRPVAGIDSDASSTGISALMLISLD